MLTAALPKSFHTVSGDANIVNLLRASSSSALRSATASSIGSDWIGSTARSDPIGVDRGLSGARADIL